MSTKTSEDHLNNSRLGAYAESLVKTFLLEHCDFAYETQSKHPADLICELGSARYTVQVKARNITAQKKFTFASENTRKLSETHKKYNVDILAMVFMPNKQIMFKSFGDSQTYYTFNESVLTPDMELETFQDTLNQLSSIPVLNSLIK